MSGDESSDWSLLDEEGLAQMTGERDEQEALAEEEAARRKEEKARGVKDEGGGGGGDRNVVCLICGRTGHAARNCAMDKRKSGEGKGCGAEGRKEGDEGNGEGGESGISKSSEANKKYLEACLFSSHPESQEGGAGGAAAEAGGAMAMMMRHAEVEEMRKMGKMGHSESAPAFLAIPRGGGEKKRVRRRRDRNVRLARLDRGVVRPKSPHEMKMDNDPLTRIGGALATSELVRVTREMGREMGREMRRERQAR